MITCVYHRRDFDGICSASIVKKRFPDVNLIGWDYEDELPTIEDKQTVILVDVSFPPQVMEQYAYKAKEFIWIDHHKSAINDYEKYFADKPTKKLLLNTSLDTNHSACELTWFYFFEDIKLPSIVKLLGTYDIFREYGNSFWNEEVIPFQLGLKAKCTSVETFPSHLLRAGEDFLPILSIIQDGKIIQRYTTEQNKLICQSAFEIEFEGLKAICLNAGVGSQTFNSIWDNTKYDVMLCFQYTGKTWRVSLYSDKPEVDCSAICKLFNGGGHKGAAGFQTTNINSIIERKK